MFYKKQTAELDKNLQKKLKELSCQLSLRDIKQLESLFQDEWQMLQATLEHKEYSNKNLSREELQERINRVVNLFATISFLSERYFDMEIHLELLDKLSKV